MNLRTILLIFFAVAAAALTATFAKGWIADQRAALEAQAPKPEAAPPLPTVDVLVARQDLPTGTFLQPKHLKWQPWPEEAVAVEYLTRKEKTEQDFDGAVVRSRIVAGEPITPSRVAHPGEQGFLAAVLEPDKRAVSVPVDATTGIAGFVFPGDIVDVILTFRTGVKDTESAGGQTRYFSETLLRDVKVLAVDQQVENKDGTAKVAKTATLEVSQKQAEKISLALEIGSLSLSLRSLAHDEGASLPQAQPGAAGEAANEAQHSYTRDIDVYYMLGDPYGLPMPGGHAQGVEVLRGSKAEQVKF
jgi:pilus assembly protein CpaB